MANGKNQLKVLYIITSGNLGGAQVHLNELISGLSENIKAYVIMGERLWLWDEMTKLNVQLFHLESLVRSISVVDDIKSIFYLTKIINEVRPDLIHCHSSKAGFLGRIAGKICCIPIVFTVHGWAFTEGVSLKKRVVYRMLERMAAKWTSKVICVSEYDRQLGLEAMPESGHKLVTIHNGIRDMAPPQKNNCEKHAVLRLIMVARFSQPKEQTSLIQAVDLLKKQGIRFHLTFVGEGPELVRNQKLAEALQLSDDVQFLGSRLDVDKILSCHDIFVLISKWEGLPISILEAMQQGMPVIATNVGGVCEEVSAGETGFLIPPGDLEGLVDCLRELHDNTNLRVKMGISSRERFAQLFTLEAMLVKTLAVYAEATIAKRNRN